MRIIHNSISKMLLKNHFCFGWGCLPGSADIFEVICDALRGEKKRKKGLMSFKPKKADDESRKSGCPTSTFFKRFFFWILLFSSSSSEKRV